MAGEEITPIQTTAMNNIATNYANVELSENNIEADTGSLFTELNDYQDSPDNNVEHSDMYNHIDKVMGVDNFIALISDEQGRMNQEMLEGIAGYEDDNKFTSKDINSMVADIRDAASEDSKKTDKEDKADSKKTNETQSTKPARLEDTDDFKYEYDSDGNLKSMYDVKKNCTTNYKYENGKLKTSETTTKDESGNSVTMNTCTYNDLGQVESKHELISEETGMKGDYFHVYTYDDQGRIQSTKLYNGDSASGTQIGDYVYEYEGDSKLPSSRTNLISKDKDGTVETTKYSYDSNNNLISSSTTITGEDGNPIATSECQYNEDGTIKSMTKDGVKHEYTYENGIRTQEDITGNDSKSPNKIYYQGGKISAEVVGDKTYVYKEVDGKQVKEVYNTSDCEDGVPKAGAEPIANYNFQDRSNGMPTISYEELKEGIKNGTIDTSAAEKLGSNAQNVLGTTLKCNWGVSNTIWNTYGLTQDQFLIPTGGEFNDTLESSPVGDNFIKISGVKSSELGDLPAGAAICWEQQNELSNGLYGHCSICLGDGQESSDHIQQQIIYDDIEFTVYYPIS